MNEKKMERCSEDIPDGDDEGQKEDFVDEKMDGCKRGWREFPVACSNSQSALHTHTHTHSPLTGFLSW